MLRVKFKIIQVDFGSYNRAVSSLPLFYSLTPNFSAKSTQDLEGSPRGEIDENGKIETKSLLSVLSMDNPRSKYFNRFPLWCYKDIVTKS